MDEFLGQIRLFAGAILPINYAYCDGELLNISEYEALYSILGTTYGGDGVKTFGLPNLKARVPVHYNDTHHISSAFGKSSTTLTVDNMPIMSSTNAVMATNSQAQDDASQSTALSADNVYNSASTPLLVNRFAPVSLNMTGSAGCAAIFNIDSPNISINVIQPTIYISYIICIKGLYPDLQ